jgi:phosphopantetheine--protein transferase-like protein
MEGSQLFALSKKIDVYSKEYDNKDFKRSCAFMMGIGIDLIEIERIRLLIQENIEFCNLMFRPEERKLNHVQLAGNFAAKEALFKACSSGIQFRFEEVALLRHPKSKKPYFVFFGQLQAALREHSVLVSLSNSKTLAIAVVCIHPPGTQIQFENFNSILS